MPQDKLAAVMTVKVTRQRRLALWLAHRLMTMALWLIWGQVDMEFKIEEDKE